MPQNPQIATIVRPPKEVFREDSIAMQESGELAISGNFFEKVEYPEEGGQLVHYYDHPFPCKGNPYPEAVDAIKVPKKLFKSTAYFLKAHKITTAFILLLPNFILKRFVRSFMQYQVRDFAFDVMSPHFLAENRYTPMVREIRRAANKVVDTFEGEWKNHGQVIVDLLGSVLEYDNAWRYRVQDVLAEIDKAAFDKNPVKEIKRLAYMEMDRERNSMSSPSRRFAQMASAVSVVMFFKPILKKTLKQFIAELDPAKVALDEGDEYYCLLRPDYDIHNVPFEKRQRKALKIIQKYNEDFPNRIAEAQKSEVIKTQILDGMKSMVINEKGFPLVMFYAIQDEHIDDQNRRKVTVRQMETITLKQNPQLRKLCQEALQKEPAKEQSVPTL